MSKMYKGLAKAKEERNRSFASLALLERPDIPDMGECEENDPTDIEQKPERVAPIRSGPRIVALNPEVMMDNRCMAMFPPQEKVDAYRGLRTKIMNRTWVTGGNLIMVAGALPGEGATLTAINLAFTFALGFKEDTLLVDCDLKKQSIHKVMGFNNDKGLADHLLGDCPASDLFVCPGVEKLNLISGGKTMNESSELIGSPRLKDLVAELKDRYPEGSIFFDVPPILSGPDALSLIPLVDHVLMVVQAGRSSTADVNKAAQLIPKQKLLGLVLNRCRN